MTSKVAPPEAFEASAVELGVGPPGTGVKAEPQKEELRKSERDEQHMEGLRRAQKAELAARIKYVDNEREEAERVESKEKSLHYKLASLEARLNLTSERLDRTLELTKQSDQKIDELIRSGREDREALKAQLDGISEALAKSA